MFSLHFNLIAIETKLNKNANKNAFIKLYKDKKFKSNYVFSSKNNFFMTSVLLPESGAIYIYANELVAFLVTISRNYFFLPA